MLKNRSNGETRQHLENPNKMLSPTNASPTSKLPSHTDVYTTSPSAAGIPVLEIVRKLEDEKALTREDRLALNAALYHPILRDKVCHALRDVELGVSPKFAIMRLKVLIHQNHGGAPRGDNKIRMDPILPDIQPKLPSIDHPDASDQAKESPRSQKAMVQLPPIKDYQCPDTKATIERVIGCSPMYSSPDNFNVCQKLILRLKVINMT